MLQPREIKQRSRKSAVVLPCIATDLMFKRAGAQLPCTTYTVYTQRDLEMR